MLIDQSNNIPLETKITEDDDGNLFLKIPEEILETLGWEDDDEIEMSVFADRLIFRKVLEPGPLTN
jgi:hypothetical protein